MSLKKRGLGRGLEALLVDVDTKDAIQQSQTLPTAIIQPGKHLPPDEINSDELQNITIALIETLQQENLNLLQEAEALRNLLDEFEAMVRCL